MVITRAVRPPENISFYDFFLESKTSFLWSLRSMGAGPITFFSFCSFPGQTRLRAVKFLMHRRCCDVRRTRQVLRFRFLSLVSQHRFLVDYSDSTYTIHAVYIVQVRRASQLFLVRYCTEVSFRLCSEYSSTHQSQTLHHVVLSLVWWHATLSLESGVVCPRVVPN